MILPGKGVLEVIGAVTEPVMVVFINVKVSDISLNTLNSWSMEFWVYDGGRELIKLQLWVTIVWFSILSFLMHSCTSPHGPHPHLYTIHYTLYPQHSNVQMMKICCCIYQIIDSSALTTTPKEDYLILSYIWLNQY